VAEHILKLSRETVQDARARRKIRSVCCLKAGFRWTFAFSNKINSFGSRAPLISPVSKEHNVALTWPARNDLGLDLSNDIRRSLTIKRRPQHSRPRPKEEIYAQAQTSHTSRPELRENARGNRRPPSRESSLSPHPSSKDMRGRRYRLHSTASDGRNTVEEMGESGAAPSATNSIAITDPLESRLCREWHGREAVPSRISAGFAPRRNRFPGIRAARRNRSRHS